MALPSGKEYDSCDENDGPTGEILEDAALVGVEERCPVVAAANAPRESPTRGNNVATNAKETAKQLTKKQATMTRALEWARCCLRECPRSTPTTRVKARSERARRGVPGTVYGYRESGRAPGGRCRRRGEVLAATRRSRCVCLCFT